MDDSFQFIIESPQHTQGHKKRPRLVTSCDNCRLKKIKCLQPSPETKCEACKAAKIPCRFRDRERYFAERSRAITGPPSGSAYPDEQSRRSSSSMDSFSPTGVVASDGERGGRYSYSADGRRHAGTSPMPSYQSRSDPNAYSYIPSTTPPHLMPARSESPRITGQLHLFDPESPQRPSHSLMPHFIQLFFEHMGREFTFISYDEIATAYWEQRLPTHLANCIAGMASRYSTLPELTSRGLHNVAEAYTDNAKSIANSAAQQPTIDVLHSLMLLSWSEYKNNRMTGFRSYCQMAMRMAMDLGLSDQNAAPLHASEAERNRRRTTWAGILQLHMTNSSLR